MPAELPQLVAWIEQLEAQRGRRARLLASWRAGVRRQPDLERLAQRAPDLTTPEPFLAARETHVAASDAEKPALARIMAAFFAELADVRSAGARSAELSALSQGQVSVELELLALPEAMRELPACTDRKRRLGLARGVAGALASVEPQRAERLDRTLELAAQLELGGEAGWGALHGLDLAALAAQAESVLALTRDAALDLMQYRFRRARIDAGGGGSEHDARLALELLDLREHLAPHLSPMLAEQLARELGLDPLAQGAISVDAEARPGRFPGLDVAVFSSDEIAVVHAPLGGPADLDRLAQGLGEALHRASIEREDAGVRRFVDPALPRATGLLWAAVLSDPAWSRRMLRLPVRAARELAQGFALRALMGLREAAARFLVARELGSQGPGERTRELYRERLGKALGVDVRPEGAFELELEREAAELRAHGLAHALGRALLEGYNEDWWRNPHSTELLRAFWSPGGAVALDGLVSPKREPADAAAALVARASE